MLFGLAYGQFNDAGNTNKKNKPFERENMFTLRGVVKMKDSWEGVKDADLSIANTEFTKTNSLGEFKIQAALGDEVEITHPSFEKVVYKVTSEEKLTIYIEKGVAVVKEDKKYKQAVTGEVMDEFNSNLYKANSSLKKDAATSIDYVSKALEISLENELSKSNVSRAYEKLGEIYLYWNQYDLAISNFRLSKNLFSTPTNQLQLAKAYYLNGEYNLSIQTLKNIKKSKLSNYQKVQYYEALGDAYIALKQEPSAENNYRKGLTIAEKHLITPKITDLNSKIGDVFAQEGKYAEADDYYNNSLQLAESENIQRSIQESDKVADFLSQNNRFDEEIELRKRNLEQVKELPKPDSVFTISGLGNSGFLINDNSVSNTISPQKLNYKIGDAYFKQSKFKEAIPYLEKSIKEANKREDLIVEKDATKKLSKAYDEQLDFVTAYEIYKNYVALVEKLYIKKEQEIVQASRFNQRITKSQNRITSLEKDRELSEGKLNLAMKDSQLALESNKTQKTIIYSLLFGLFLISLLAYYMYRNVKQQKLNNNLLALKQLRSQMNPHFIFNALNSVNSFIATNDERTANRYLSEFSQLMRSVLENSEQDFIPLSKEIELLEIYTKLEHFRFQDKFDYEIHVDEDIEVADFQIPPMLLQPYVENAVWHGLRYKEEKGSLMIHVKQVTSSVIQISIEDNGIGREKSKELKTQHQKKQQSKGMGNIKKRVAILNEMYDDKVDVAIVDKPNHTGTKVILTLKKD